MGQGKKILIGAVAVVVLAAGSTAAWKMRGLLTRRTLAPTVVVVAEYDATALDNERYVAIPIEIASPPEATLLESVSTRGGSRSTLAFAPGTDLLAARSAVIERLSRVDLPSGVIAQLEAPAGGVTLHFVSGPGPGDAAELRAFVDWELERALKQLPGVADVSSCGGRMAHVEVVVDDARAAAFGLGVLDVAGALEKHPTHSLGDVGFASLQAIAAVGLDEKGAVRVSDVAQLRMAHAPAPCVATLDGKTEVVVSTILLGTNADVDQVARLAAERLRVVGLPVHAAPLDFGLPEVKVARTRERLLSVRVPKPVLGQPGPGLAGVLAAIRSATEVHALYTSSDEPAVDARDALLVRVLVEPGPRNVREHANAIAAALGRLGVRHSVSSPSETLPSELGELRVRVMGGDLAVLGQTGARIAASLGERPSLVGISVIGAESSSQQSVTLDRAAAALRGVSAADVERTVTAALGSLVVGRLDDRGRRVDIVVAVPLGNPVAEPRPKGVGDVLVRGADGHLVPLGTVANIRREAAPLAVLRAGKGRYVEVRFSSTEGTTPATLADVRERLAKAITLPPGYALTVEPVPAVDGD